MDKRIAIAAIVSAIGGGAIGSAVTYFTVKKIYTERAQRDIDDVKQAYKDKYDGKRVVNIFNNGATAPDEELSEPTILRSQTPDEKKRAEEFVEALGYKSAGVAEPNEDDEERERIISIYERHETPPTGVTEVTDIRMRDYDLMDRVNRKLPFIISAEDFYNTQTEWDKLSFTYYEDDDVLAGDDERAIDNVEYLIGDDHLSLFGVMSDDPSIVFVRNVNISADIEITRNSGSYTEVVHGIPKGSDKVGTRAFRGDDD